MSGRRFRIVAGLSVALLAVALAPIGAGAQSDTKPPDVSGAAPNVRGQVEIDISSSNLTPSPRQHLQFMLEEHGYDIALPDPNLAPTPRQHIQFMLEEHGYDIVLPDPELTPSSCQRIQFVLEEHDYDVDYPCN